MFRAATLVGWLGEDSVYRKRWQLRTYFYVFVQRRPSAVNRTLPAFAAERRHLLSIDISCLYGAQQQTLRTPLLLLIDGTDRRTDGRAAVS